jgi:hypothetical protein
MHPVFRPAARDAASRSRVGQRAADDQPKISHPDDALNVDDQVGGLNVAMALAA